MRYMAIIAGSYHYVKPKNSISFQTFLKSISTLIIPFKLITSAIQSFNLWRTVLHVDLLLKTANISYLTYGFNFHYVYYYFSWSDSLVSVFNSLFIKVFAYKRAQICENCEKIKLKIKTIFLYITKNKGLKIKTI